MQLAQGLLGSAQGRRDPLEFENLQAAPDPEIQAAMVLLSNTAASAYFGEPNLMPLIGLIPGPKAPKTTQPYLQFVIDELLHLYSLEVNRWWQLLPRVRAVAAALCRRV